MNPGPLIPEDALYAWLLIVFVAVMLLAGLNALVRWFLNRRRNTWRSIARNHARDRFGR